jgi:hypothetical protein
MSATCFLTGCGARADWVSKPGRFKHEKALCDDHFQKRIRNGASRRDSYEQLQNRVMAPVTPEQVRACMDAIRKGER